MTQTLGQRRVRVGFNPTADSLVDQIKAKTAELIDLTNSLDPPKNFSGEFGRLLALAMTHYEDAAMWAVKAATMPKE